MPRKLREVTLNVTVKLIPHPDPERAMNLIAGLVLDRVLEKMELRKGGKTNELTSN